jgi:hypothetical protein
LQHWHYDVWVGRDDGELFGIHEPHPFDPTNPLLFETDATGAISSVSIALEPAVASIRFLKRREGAAASTEADGQARW